jgi:hypothetical protein
VTGGRTLLAALDAALADHVADPADDAPHARGFAAATGLNDLLIRHRLGWDDVVTPGSRLAKLCGRLGSEYRPEQQAAYHHAVRLIMACGASWTELVRLPESVQRAAPEPVVATASVFSPPEEDWMHTVRGLKARAAWRSDGEHARLDALERELQAGHEVEPQDAVWLRDVWWHAELNNPEPEEAIK